MNSTPLVAVADTTVRRDLMQWIAALAVILLCLSGAVWPVLYYSQGNQAAIALANVQILQTALAQRTAELEQIKQAIADHNARVGQQAPPDTTRR